MSQSYHAGICSQIEVEFVLLSTVIGEHLNTSLQLDQMSSRDGIFSDTLESLAGMLLC